MDVFEVLIAVAPRGLSKVPIRIFVEVHLSSGQKAARIYRRTGPEYLFGDILFRVLSQLKEGRGGFSVDPHLRRELQDGSTVQITVSYLFSRVQ
jgi:hypothetical protein